MRRKYSLLIIFMLLLALLLPLTAASFSPYGEPEVPKAAEEIVEELDRQLEEVYLSEDYHRSEIPIVCTVPVSINNLQLTNPLSRQMTEELSTQLLMHGYAVDELRKANALSILPGQGEFMLTREVEELALTHVSGVAVMTGTYTVSTESVRYSISIIHLPTNRILAKASATVPIRDEIRHLLYEDAPLPPLMPTVQTRLN